jgi:hypothetical protein
MALDAIALAAAGTLGAAGGLALSLYVRRKKATLPQATAGGWWAAIRRLTDERAEAASKQKALQKAYAAHAIDEGAYVTKESHYAKLIAKLDTEMDEAIKHLSGEFMPAETVAAAERIRKAGDATAVASELVELRKLKAQLEKERDELNVRLTEADDERMTHVAHKNRASERAEEAEWRVKALNDRIKALEREKEAAEGKAHAYEKASPIKGLSEENKLLRDSLARSHDQLSLTKNELAIMSALVDRHADEIEGKELRTPQQMCELITPKDRDVERIAKDLDTPANAFKFVRDDIREVHTKVNATFWMKPAEVLKIGGADHEDRMLLLCSLLRALGKDARVVTVELQNGMTRSVVGMDDVVLDPRRHADYNDYQDLSTEGALKRYAFDGFGVRKVLAEFDDERYRKI